MFSWAKNHTYAWYRTAVLSSGIRMGADKVVVLVTNRFQSNQSL
jgi:hypothetical protein